MVCIYNWTRWAQPGEVLKQTGILRFTMDIFVFKWLPLFIRTDQVQACIKSDFLILSTNVAELHLKQRVTPKRSWTITIFLRVVIFNERRRARDQLVLHIITYFIILYYTHFNIKRQKP